MPNRRHLARITAALLAFGLLGAAATGCGGSPAGDGKLSPPSTSPK